MRFLLLLIPLLLQAITFKVASYNVENLFDVRFNGGEYVEYIPNGKYGWNRFAYQKKLSNLSKVIYDLKADIIAFEEIENLKALLDLKNSLKRRGLVYRYYAIANRKNTTVKVALFSKFKILQKKELQVGYGNQYRNILEVKLDVDGYPLLVFVNHWKSKSASERERIKYAKALRKRLDAISTNQPYIILGDFNSNYNEYITFKKNRKLNTTYGKTGINHTLRTVVDGKMVSLNDLKHNCSLLYNLWLELPKGLRYSYFYHRKKNTIDNILLPCAMFDGVGIEYIKNSFGVFKPKYLFKNGYIYRWQKRKKYGKFSAKGYSDHLPIYAIFTTDKKHPIFARKKFIQSNNKGCFLYKDGMNLTKEIYQDRVICKLSGVYKKRYLYYGQGKKIRLYSKIKRFYIKNGAKITVKNAKIISYKHELEIILYNKDQIEVH